MNKNQKLVIFIFIVFVIIILIFSINKYFYRAAIHLYPNIDDYKIFDNRVINSGRCSKLPKSQFYNKKKIPYNYYKWIEYFKTTAFIVIKDGKIVHESYYRGYNDYSISNSFSVSKSIISLLIGIAIDKGFIGDINDYVYKYYPPFNNIYNRNLRIIDLLTMSSGLNWDESYSNIFSQTTKAYYGDDLEKLIKDLKVVEKPGNRFKYLSANTQILAYILNNATGKTLSEFAKEELWGPIEACGDAMWSLDKNYGTEKAFCCFNASATDFARIGLLILNDGKWKGKQIVSRNYIDKIKTPASWLKKEYGNDVVNDYSLHWWIMQYHNKEVVYARGIQGQYIFVVPDKKLVVVRLGEKKSSLRSGNLPSDIYIWLNLAYSLI